MKAWLMAAGMLAATAVQGQTVSSVSLEPSSVKPGEPVKITVNFEPTDTVNCGFRLRFGDGTESLVKVNRPNEIPHSVTRSYPNAGRFTVEADPVKVGGSFKCSGKPQTAQLTVVAPAPAPAAVAPAPAPAVAPVPVAAAAKPSLCPAGWVVVKPGQNVKTKAFSCSAKPGSKIPEPKLSCPGQLTYFENSAKGQLGCRV